MGEDGSFLSRWSKRKVEVKRGAVLPEPAIPQAAMPGPVPVVEVAVPVTDVEPAPPLPTLDDVAALTRESSFARFVAPDVPPDVKNAAMKKLFTDPHYNIMDGLDTYIDDYGIPDPIPESMLRQMTQSKFLGLFDHEDDAEPTLEAHEDADLRLQQDDAAGRPGTEPSPDDRTRG